MGANQHNSRERLENANWYAIYIKHNHERKSADLLTRKGLEVFLPFYDSVRRWKDRKKSLSMPLFPGYVFLKSTLQNKIEILSTPGVFFIVENAGRACPIPEHEIQAIRTIVQSDAKFEPHAFLKSGELVRIRSGPLAGIAGIFLKPKNNFRIVVSIELLRKAIAIEVDAANVDKIDGGQDAARLFAGAVRSGRDTSKKVEPPAHPE
jgi:transcription antitermination factor NusG